MSNEKCILCESDAIPVWEEVFDTRFGIDTAYEISKCSVCGLEQTTPLPSEGELKSLYETHYNFGGEKGTIYTNLRTKFFSSGLYDLGLALDGDISFHGRKGSGRLLDIGCNEGRGLSIYKKNGFGAEGLELNDKAAEEARSKGFVVYSDLVENFKPSKLYDVVVLSNVLEHSLKPNEMLSHVRRILNPGGQVWISCPNNRSWLRSLFGRFWINWHVPFHIVHFSLKTLENLLLDSGFEVKAVKIEMPALWGAHSIIGIIFTRRGRPTKQLRNPFLVMVLIALIRGMLFPLLWFGNFIGRGDCLVVTAEKV